MFVVCFQKNPKFYEKMFSTIKQLQVKTKLPQAQNIWSWFPCVNKCFYICCRSCVYLLFSFHSKSLTTDLDSNQRNLNRHISSMNRTMLYNLKFEKIWKKPNFIRKLSILIWHNYLRFFYTALNDALTRFDKICCNNKTMTINFKLSHQSLILCL